MRNGVPITKSAGRAVAWVRSWHEGEGGTHVFVPANAWHAGLRPQHETKTPQDAHLSFHQLVQEEHFFGHQDYFDILVFSSHLPSCLDVDCRSFEFSAPFPHI